MAAPVLLRGTTTNTRGVSHERRTRPGGGDHRSRQRHRPRPGAGGRRAWPAPGAQRHRRCAPGGPGRRVARAGRGGRHPHRRHQRPAAGTAAPRAGAAALRRRRPAVQQRRGDADRLQLGDRPPPVAAPAGHQPRRRDQRHPRLHAAAAGPGPPGPGGQHCFPRRPGLQPHARALHRQQAGGGRALGNPPLRTRPAAVPGGRLGALPGPGGQRHHGLQQPPRRGHPAARRAARQQHPPGHGPRELAREVFVGIAAGRFWLLPHKSFKPALERRLASILDETNPAFQMADI